MPEHGLEDRRTLQLQSSPQHPQGLLMVALLSEGHAQPSMSWDELVIELQSLAEAANGGIEVPGEVMRPAGMHGDDERQRIEIRLLGDLFDCLIEPPARAEKHRVPVVC